MIKNCDEYYLGLDIGTESVGWAVTDTSYKVLRINNKPTMGVRLFTQANTAADRRTNRAARRRLQRRKERILLLQSIFAEAIGKVDSGFFVRLEDSNLYDGDKREKTKFSLFNDRSFTDRDFHKKYPTVFHLRNAMRTAQNPDTREVYLALHHIIKYRGNFLIEGDISAIEDISEPLRVINEYLSAEEADVLDLSKEKEDCFKKLLIEKGSITKKVQQYIDCFGISTKQTELKSLMELIAGKKVDIKKLYAWKEIDIDEEDGKDKIDFKDANRTETEDKLRQSLRDDFVLIEKAGQLYDYSQYKGLMGDHAYLSEAMTEKYNKHRSDLAALKSVIRKYFDKATYNAVFGSSKDANYTAYVKKVKFGDKTFTINKTANNEDFCKFISKILNGADCKNEPDVKEILNSIENGNFMPKQVSIANSILPYQLNMEELKAILENAAKYPQFDFLKAHDSEGYTAMYKIEELLKFRMPYYVGPVNNHSGKYWAKRLEDGKVYPWNLNNKIDLEQSEEAFIQRMTNQCPYIFGEKVLPKCSLYYEEFALLNIINKLRINGELIDVELKNKLSQYFANTGYKRMKRSALEKWLREENQLQKSDVVVIEGIDEEIAVGRRFYYLFSQLLGGPRKVEEYKEQIEEIILWATIAGPEKTNLKRRIKKNCDFLDDAQISKIAGWSFKGWGGFSKMFLTKKVAPDLLTGEEEQVSILDSLRQSNANLSELLGDDYCFSKRLRQSKDKSENVSYDDIDELYCSPAVKKQIWQTVCIVKELKKVIGKAPKKIFIEMARGIDIQKEARDRNNRSLTRKNELLAAFETLRRECPSEYDKALVEALKKEDFKELQGKKLYLYYTQNGKDMYSYKSIALNRLSEYDIDHIYPRSKIKDDSIRNNLVLTSRRHNSEKGDTYPLPKEVRDKMKPFWEILKRQGLITVEKYNRLIRNTPLTVDECGDFINRQLTETQQSTKEAAAIMKRIFPDSEVVYSKASNVSDFRNLKKNQGDKRIPRFVKVREINDLHHARDAYLNIVVGNVWNTKFEHNAKAWLKQNGMDHYNLGELFNKPVVAGGVVAWQLGNNDTMKQVEKTMISTAVLFTREAYVQKGRLFKTTMQKKGDGELVPLKSSIKNEKFAKMRNIAKYGGYTGESRCYYMLVKNVVGKKEKYTILGVTTKDMKNITDNASRIKYCLDCGLINPEIILDRIKIDALFSMKGSLLNLSSMTGKQIVWKLAMQTSFEDEEERYIKKVMSVVKKYNRDKKKDNKYQADEFDEVNIESNLRLYDAFVDKLSQEKYSNIQSLSSFNEKIKNRRDLFEKLDVTKQCVVLSEILKAFQCNAQLSDLSLLEEDDKRGKNCGKIYTSCNFDSLDDIIVINRSITGIFEKKVLLK